MSRLDDIQTRAETARRLPMTHPHITVAAADVPALVALVRTLGEALEHCEAAMDFAGNPARTSTMRAAWEVAVMHCHESLAEYREWVA